MFKAGDRLRVVSGRCGSVDSPAYIIISSVRPDGQLMYTGYNELGEVTGTCYGCYTEENLEHYNGETTMDEVKTPADFVRVERNTELFAKGTTFKNQGQYYEALDSSKAFVDGSQPGMYARVALATVQRLTKVFVPVIKFNPEYVTEEENEKLQAVLKPVTKKAVKKVAKKAKK